MEIIVNQIQSKYEAQQAYYYYPHPRDYICSPDQFIRPSKPGERLSYVFFQKTRSAYGEGWSVAYTYSEKELIQLLQDKNILLSQCKTQSRRTLSIAEK